MNSFTDIFQVFWQLRKNTYLKEHLWTADSKETDVIKSAVKVYKSLHKRCGVTPHFLQQGKISTKKLFVRKFSVAEVEDVNCAVLIIYAKTSF